MNKALRSRSSLRKLGKKKRQKIAKRGAKSQVVSLPQLELTSLRSRKAKRRNNVTVLERMFLGLSIITVIRRITIPKIAPS